MNVVGKVGSLISQGVYSVATPFHPFGGAVDVIVVQQPDGTFRSTPWYVRFGKFQGVIKGAEKIVRISVNGVEANFHMYLDNSGEAYFIREVESGKQNEANGVVTDAGNLEVAIEGKIVGDGNRRLDHSVSDSGVTQSRDKYDFSREAQLERAESDVDKRFYDIESGQSLLEGSDELSEYGSNRYDSLDNESFVESQGLASEVILVSVDGHVLTAPISASEQNTENLQLSIPQFHLGPGDSTEFCEENEDFSSGDNAWAVDYFSKLNASTTANVASDTVSNLNNDDDASKHMVEVCEGEAECVHQALEIQRSRNLEDLHRHSDLEDLCATVKREDVFKSCLELTELVKQVENGNCEDTNSPLEVLDSQNKSPNSLPDVNKTEEGTVVECMNSDGLSPSCNSDLACNNGSPDLQVQSIEHIASDKVSVHSVGNDLEAKEEQFDVSVVAEEFDNRVRRSETQDECSASEIVEPQTTTSSEGLQLQSSTRFEISLCGSELHAGMGLSAATEAFDARRISADEFKSNATSITCNENLIIRFGERYWTWEKAAPFVLGMAAYGLDLPFDPKDAIPVEHDETLKQENDSVSTPTSSGRRWRLWPIPFRRVKTLEHASSSSSNEDVFVDTESGLQNSQFESTPPASPIVNDSPRKQLLRTNVPTNEQIASLNLKEGQNMITFSFSTRVLGTQQVDAHIYLWKWNAKIVISDVDGTITKSDVLGQFMPLVGKDWTQSGVARLFCAIKENGYQLLFLSARAIVQAYLTRSFLLNLKQDGKALPNGPVVISPDGLLPSLYREVIRRAPHEFKISCLEDIKKLFPSDYNPFYAGFGNRDTDELSYRKIGIPKGKIFIINPKGEVAISHCIDVRSYTSLHTLVNDMFPPTSKVEQEDYNSWNYWRVPLQDIES